jgi:hypothetical protein
MNASLYLKLNALPLFLAWFMLTSTLLAQPYKENNKWGIRENETVIIPAVYDTVFDFDATGQVCLACFKTKGTTANKFIKIFTTTYACNYLNKKNERLKIRNGRDTCTVFSLGKQTINQYSDLLPTFVVSAKGKKNLVSKNFKQLTRRGYHEISTSAVPEFYIAREEAESEIVFTGVINAAEDEIVPYQYSGIVFNTSDSLIIACSAGVRPNADDDIYNYSGKRIESYHRHVELATRNFIVHKLFEPKEHYVIYNIKSREEINLAADEVLHSNHDEILVRIKNDWYLYDLNTNTKKPTKQS